MLIRKKAIKIQERLGMRLGVVDGTSSRPIVKNLSDVTVALNDLYRVGLRAFVLPKELFEGIANHQDIYTTHYSNLLKIRDMAKKFNIELSIRHDQLTDQPDDMLKTIANVANIMDCRNYIINPSFYSKIMPPDQALRLAVYKINEMTTHLRVKVKMGVEVTPMRNEVGSFDDIIDIVKRTHGTEPVINWGHAHAREGGAYETQKDFNLAITKMRQSLGMEWMKRAYFIFSGVQYNRDGLVKYLPLRKSNMKLDYLIREIMSYDMKGTLVIQDPERENFIADMLEELADMVR